MRPLLITGPPGCGKTTIVQKLATLVPDAAGFITKEIREAGVRKGFRLLNIATGEARVLAHVDISGHARVGKYGVDVDAFQSFLTRLDLHAPVVLIDEIGKMECLSTNFRTFIEKLLRSDTTIIATIAQHGTLFIESLKRIPDATLIQITPLNRDSLPGELVEMFKKNRTFFL